MAASENVFMKLRNSIIKIKIKIISSFNFTLKTGFFNINIRNK